jgi:hypothetical protein
VKQSEARRVLVQYAEVVAGQVSGVGQLETVAVDMTVTVTWGMEEQVDGMRPEAGRVSLRIAREGGLTRCKGGGRGGRSGR